MKSIKTTRSLKLQKMSLFSNDLGKLLVKLNKEKEIKNISINKFLTYLGPITNKPEKNSIITWEYEKEGQTIHAGIIKETNPLKIFSYRIDFENEKELTSIEKMQDYETITEKLRVAFNKRLISKIYSVKK